MKTGSKKDLQYIKNNKAALAKGIEKGYIFRTEPSTDQLLQLYLFDLFSGNSWINQEAIKQAYLKGENREVGQKNCKIIKEIWKEEIDAFNKALFANQKTIF